MIKSYIKTALRNLRRFKLYSVINIVGLAVGMAVFILIMQFVRFQLSFDSFNKNADRIYRVVWKSIGTAGGFPASAITPEPLAPALREEFPQIESVVRIEKYYPVPVVSYGEKRFYEKRVLEADPTFFDVFTFKFLEGDSKTALDNLNSVVITQSVARKYFGAEDPIGRIMTFDSYGKSELTVTGVIEDVPANSSFKFDFLVRLQAARDVTWYMASAYTYILLKRGDTPAHLKKQFPQFLDKYVKDEFTKGGASKTVALELQPLRYIHLHSNLDSELEPNGDIRYVEIFSMIAVLILIAACVNYTNISTSRYLRRINEIGVRKAIGANRRTLIFQMLAESVLLSFVSLVISLVLVEIFSHLLIRFLPGIEVPSLSSGHSSSLSALLVVLAAVTGVLSGAYPAFYISRLEPTQMLRGSVSQLPITFNLRRVLIVFQFVIASLILLGTVVLFGQLRFIENARLGFDKENVIVVDDPASSLSQQYEPFKNELLESPYITSVTSGDVPGQGGGFTIFKYVNGRPVGVRVIDADFDYLRTLRIQLKDGRAFRSITDTANSLVNEACANVMNSGDVIGNDLHWVGRMSLGTIVGVVKNFDMTSLRDSVAPVMIRLRPGEHGNVIIRMKPTQTLQAIGAIRKTWNKFVKYRPLQFSFLSDDLNRLYTSDEKLASLFGIFAFVGIFIACLGLFGLSALTAEQRTKEVGIRKAFGASVSNIVSLLSKEFLVLVLVSNLFAWPIAYYALSKWLQGFAYRISLGIWIFVLAGVVVLAIAIVTVSYQAIRAARANPVEALRYE